MPEHRLMPRLPALASVLAATALTACGGSSSSSTSTPAGSPPSTGSTPQTTVPSSLTTPSTTTSSASRRRCTAANVALSFLGQQGATGHGELGFALRNTSSASCRTFGYPGVQFLDRSGHPLPTNAVRTTHDFVGTAPATPLVVAPGGTVSFRLGVTHGNASSKGCVTADGVQVIPPDDTATLRVTVPQGAYECGTATVTPLQPGSSAYR